MSEATTRPLCDFWYVRELPEILEPANAFSVTKNRRSLRQKLMTCWNLFRRARGRLVVPHWYEYGPLYLILAALRGDKNVVLLEFIDLRLDSRTAPVRWIWNIIVQLFVAPAMRRSVVAIQVMTRHEAGAVAKRYRIDPAQIYFIPWPLSGWELASSDPAPVLQGDPFVFASGRAACDWETLFAAANGANWSLRVVCAAGDLKRIGGLNRNGTVEVLSEVSLAAHDAIFRAATVYVLPLLERSKSAGQVRLGTGISLGVPVVASNIRGLEGYLVDGVTGIAVPPGDADALREAVDRLMCNPTARLGLATRATHAAATYGRDEYFSEIEKLFKMESPAPSTPQVHRT